MCIVISPVDKTFVAIKERSSFESHLTSAQKVCKNASMKTGICSSTWQRRTRHVTSNTMYHKQAFNYPLNGLPRKSSVCRDSSRSRRAIPAGNASNMPPRVMERAIYTFRIKISTLQTIHSNFHCFQRLAVLTIRFYSTQFLAQEHHPSQLNSPLPLQ
jgi:hypothetical protein